MKSKIFILFSILISLAVIVLINESCNKDKEEPNPEPDILVSASKNMGPDGGEIALPNGSKLIIPQDALTTETKITISRVQDAPNIGESEIEVVKLEPEGLVYNSEVTLELPLSNIQRFDTTLFLAYSIKDDQVEKLNPELDLDNKIAQIPISHHSFVCSFCQEKLYIVFDIPGKHLKKGDLIYVLTERFTGSGTGKVGWLPGHTGLYLGTGDPESNENDGSTIIESTPPKVAFGNLDDFKTEYDHIYMGAHRSAIELTDENRTAIAEYAISRKGDDYGVVFNTILNKVSCVELTEWAYEAAGLDIIPTYKEWPFMFPYAQYYHCIPVFTIEVVADSKVEIPVYGVVWDEQDSSYTKDESYFTATCTHNLEGATFNNNQFVWEPASSLIGERFEVSFKVYDKVASFTKTKLLFITVIEEPLPSIITSPVTDVTQTTAKCGGDITDQGDSEVTSRGVCWSTSENPTISSSHTTDGSGTGEFSSQLTDLTTNTKYFVRAYATNATGTAYGNQKSFIAGGSNGCMGQTSVTYEGQTYRVVEIGDQCWMAENLNVGEMITIDEQSEDNSIIEKYCYDDNEVNCEVFGGMYQWDEMMQYVTEEQTQGICPPGWHIPDDSEWCTMTTLIDSTVDCNETTWSGSNIGIKLKSDSGWISNGNGTDEYQFTVMPGGLAWLTGGTHYYNGIGMSGCFWTSSEIISDDEKAWHRNFYYNRNGIIRSEYYSKKHAFSVRCLKN